MTARGVEMDAGVEFEPDPGCPVVCRWTTSTADIIAVQATARTRVATYFALPLNPWASIWTLKTVPAPTAYSVFLSGPENARFAGFLKLNVSPPQMTGIAPRY